MAFTTKASLKSVHVCRSSARCYGSDGWRSTNAREVRVDGVQAKLKPREFALLVELASIPGVAFSRERLLQKVWGIDFVGDARTLDVHIYRLREKLEKRFGLHDVVCTVHGHGYKCARP